MIQPIEKRMRNVENYISHQEFLKFIFDTQNSNLSSSSDHRESAQRERERETDSSSRRTDRVSITNGVRAKLRETMSEEDLKRKYFLVTGEEPCNEDMENMISGGSGESELLDDIEANVANARRFVSEGTNTLFYANQMMKKQPFIRFFFI
ncbi:hypothetical protein EUTSA_v10022982mg [Eutrema salsugineum]|uniref:Syntaxin N-terminal domain-containing protein n=1 Tax=Eutrema salsugineum TaxID=72664 RepID=V4MDJ8_EUTSA|nr:hypothetical protein EUTSA_v10022982mg [Eutrema salsugineum]